MQSTNNHILINGIGTPDKDLSMKNVLNSQLIDPALQNGTLEKTDIVTVNGNGVMKHPSTSSEDFDNDMSPHGLCNNHSGWIGSFNMPEMKSMSSISDAWGDTNNNSTSDISELSISDSLLNGMGSDIIPLSNTSANSSMASENVVKHPGGSTITNGVVKQRAKSESPASSLKRRKMSAPVIDSSVSMEIPSIADDEDEVTEDFSLRRSKYAPIRRKRISLAGSCPSIEMGDLGPVPQVLSCLEESSETDGSLKSSSKPLRRSSGQQGKHKSPLSTKTHPKGKPLTDKPQHQPVASKLKAGIVAAKPPLPITKTDSSGSAKQRKKSVKGMLFPKKMARKSIDSPVEPIVEQTTKDVAKPKTKKATHKAPLGSIFSRLSPKREIPSKEDNGTKEETKQRKLSMTKSGSHSGSSLLSKTSSASSIKSIEGFQGQKSSSFTVTKEPLKSSPSEISFASREASISIESLLSDGSTDILMADSSHDLFCTTSHEDLLDDGTSSQHLQYTSSEPLLDLHQVEDTPVKLEDIKIFADEDDRGPSPTVVMTTPVKKAGKNLLAVNDSPTVVRVRAFDGNIQRAKSLEVLSSSNLTTEVEVLTSNMPASNIPSTVSVSTENLSSSPTKRRSNIIIRTVKKCVSLDLLTASKKPLPTATIAVSSKKTPTKVKPTPVTSIQKVEEKKRDVPERTTSHEEKKKDVQEKTTSYVKGTVKSKAAAKEHTGSASSPAMARQGSGRRVSGASSPFMRTNARSSTGRKKSTTVAPESKLRVSTRSASPAKKTTIVIKSSRVSSTPSKVTIISPTSSAKSTGSSSHTNSQRVASPVKSSTRRPSIQHVSSGRKKSTEKLPVKPPLSQSPSPQRPKIPFVSLFPAGEANRITRVSSDEVPVNHSNKNDMVHCRSSSEVVSNNTLGHSTGLSNIVENQLLVTSSVETLASDRVTSSMSDTSSLQKPAVTEAPVRRISSGPMASKTLPGSHTLPRSQTSARKKSVTGHPRPQSARVDHHTVTGGHHSGIGQHHSDSALKRPGSAATRRTSSTMKPSVSSGTMPRQLTKTKSDSKIGFSTVPRVRKVSETQVPSESAATKRLVRPHSAAVSRGGPQATARSSARRISLAPTSSAGKINRSSVTRRSKSIITAPDVNHLNKPGEDVKKDEKDGGKLSTPISRTLSDVKPKTLDLNRKNSSALRSSLRKTSTANKPADANSIKDGRQSTTRSSRRSIQHSGTAKATSVAAISHVTPSRKASMAGGRTGSTHLTPKLDASVSMSDLDAVKSADRCVHCNV